MLNHNLLYFSSIVELAKKVKISFAFIYIKMTQYESHIA